MQVLIHFFCKIVILFTFSGSKRERSCRKTTGPENPEEPPQPPKGGGGGLVNDGMME